jgi:hypothetical protein
MSNDPISHTALRFEGGLLSFLAHTSCIPKQEAECHTPDLDNAYLKFLRTRECTILCMNY